MSEREEEEEEEDEESITTPLTDVIGSVVNPVSISAGNLAR